LFTETYYLPLIQRGTICKWTNDSQCFILGYFDTICNSLSQLYHFALPLCPSSFWLHKYYAAELLQGPKAIKGTEVEWGKCSHTVTLGSSIFALSLWNNTISVGSEDNDIIILDATTGSQTAIFSGHTAEVICLTFSSDGKSLVSGSGDETVKLWDMQTGGVIKTFYGHTGYIWSVSISADCTKIASGSVDRTICLWDIQTGECLCVIEQQGYVHHVSFTPTNPQHIISISGDKIWQWDVNGHQILPIYSGSYIAFSPDHTLFALCNEGVITVQNSDTRATVAKFQVASHDINNCCFSPDSRLVAAAVPDGTVYVWDITNPDPHPIETLIGHTDWATSLVFSSPSSLISASRDKLVNFWQISALSTDPIATKEFTPIYSVSLQTSCGIAISSDAEGMVKTWDISTGLCKASFQTPAKDHFWRDVQLIDGRLIIVWCQDYKINIWDINRGEFLPGIDLPPLELKGLRISGDGSKVFCVTKKSIQAWAMHTGELVGEVKLELEQNWYLDPLQMDDSRIWIQFKDSSTQGWDFGISGCPSIHLFNMSTNRPLLNFIVGAFWARNPFWVKNIVTGKEVFQLSGKYAWPQETQWDGQYLIAGYDSGEVLILDFHCMYP
jgi:WD40 repeat protein